MLKIKQGQSGLMLLEEEVECMFCGLGERGGSCANENRGSTGTAKGGNYGGVYVGIPVDAAAMISNQTKTRQKVLGTVCLPNVRKSCTIVLLKICLEVERRTRKLFVIRCSYGLDLALFML
ncbi:overexpressed in colon carcinoma 1 protein isoform X2 [Rhinatrema bivittatum]|uniref:overexpressed in colon carcinoma 1 protein isoform X2 n=1 Tax=Rhinatrema bivittatum TaxID=194408 RepID=UPI001126B9B6|nr:overexpressed in colon carcinoma 1 protein isoform X2 [Rhinatrema bivittatum]